MLTANPARLAASCVSHRPCVPALCVLEHMLHQRLSSSIGNILRIVTKPAGIFDFLSRFSLIAKKAISLTGDQKALRLFSVGTDLLLCCVVN